MVSREVVLDRLCPSLWGVTIFLLIAIRPIWGSGIWWELSRGHAVLNGELGPSRSLLVADTELETDWLGGVPFYASYQALAGSGLMLCRIMTLFGIGLAVIRLGAGRLPKVTAPIVALVVLAASSRAAQPGPLLWDQLGVLCVLLFGLIGREHSGLARLLTLAACTMGWANLGPRFAAAPIVWLSAFVVSIASVQPRTHRESWRSAVMPLAVMLVAGCLTPRGVWGWWDSMRILCPRLAATNDDFSSTTFASVFDIEWGTSEYIGAGSCLLLLLWPTRIRSLRLGMGFASLVGAALAVVCALNVMWVSLWFCLLLYSATRIEIPGWPEWLKCPRLSALTQRGIKSLGRPAMGLTGLALVLVIAVASGATQSMGWGLDSRLDDRLLRLSLENIRVEGVPWSDDAAALGMWSWVTAGRFPAQDAPQRALLGGRLSQMKRLGDDLRQRRQFRYLRADGSPGGWWLDLRERNVSLLLASADDTRLQQALSPTIWQPLLLDSPVILYSQAGDLAYQDQLLRALSQREFVEFGPWQYSSAAATSSDFDRDRWGLTHPADARRTALRQAGVFRAIGLPIAALRVLNSLRRESADGEPLREMVEIQRELAHREFMATGSISPIRIALFNEYGADRRPQAAWDFTSIPTYSHQASPKMSRVAACYVQGNLGAAEQLLADTTTDDEVLVRALLRWEAGEPDPAILLLHQLQAATVQSPVRRLASWWLDLLQPAKDQAARRPHQDPH